MHDSSRRTTTVTLLLGAGVLAACSESAAPHDPHGQGGSTGGGASNAVGAGGLEQVDPTEIPKGSSRGVVANLDSAIIHIDRPVAGAADYRAFALHDGVEILVDPDGYESVTGATIHCAGLVQHSAPKTAPEVLTQIEVTGVTRSTEFVVEAVDRLCPFTGLFGRTDEQITIASGDLSGPFPELIVPVPIVSEATTRQSYGSMFFNGHGPAPQPGQPAPPELPKVIEQWTVTVEPLQGEEAESRRLQPFFADFSDESDQPEWVPGGTNGNGTFHQPDGYGYSYAIYQNSDFSFYVTNAELVRDNHVFIDRGQLHTNLPDLAQGVMSSVISVPRTLAHLPDEGSPGYLHLSFETATNSTPRRYWWLSLCGDDSAGQTMDGDGFLTPHLSLNSGFFNPDGANPSTGGWNCLLVFPHDGLATPVPPESGSNPESSVMLVVHQSGMPEGQSAVNVSPQQLNDGFPAAWYREMDAGEVTDIGILDALLRPSPRVRFDFFVSRNRVVMYVDGEQRLCNDLGPVELTMAETAVGFNTALYHSSAEHGELLVDFADRSGQRYYLENTIFAEPHTWDNVGFEENVGLPASFTDANCYTHAP
jgi:hypothetical protein